MELLKTALLSILTRSTVRGLLSLCSNTLDRSRVACLCSNTFDRSRIASVGANTLDDSRVASLCFNTLDRSRVPFALHFVLVHSLRLCFVWSITFRSVALCSVPFNNADMLSKSRLDFLKHAKLHYHVVAVHGSDFHKAMHLSSNDLAKARFALPGGRWSCLAALS